MIERGGKDKKKISPSRPPPKRFFFDPLCFFTIFLLSDDCFFIYDIEHGLGLLKWTPHTLSPHYTRP